MSIAVVLALNGIVAVAAFFCSLTGFGFALIATPFLVLLFPPTVAVPLVLASWVPLSVLLFLGSRREMSARRIGNLLIGSAIGVPIGVYLLTNLGATPMRLAIGSFTLLAALALVLRPIRPLGRERTLCFVGGLLGGVSGGATAMSGPPVVFVGLSQGWEPRGFRADLIGFFSIVHICVLLLLHTTGNFDFDVLTLGLASLPGLMIGYVVGMKANKKLSSRLFRNIAIGLVLAGGVLVFAEELSSDLFIRIVQIAD